jgi:FAD/FMN-containing dehydrogenase
MGYAGLISDNIVSMDVVTAEGSQITVSAFSHPELYWGMRGAGHNYGIVTNLVYKIFDYPRGQSTYYVNYFYSEDKLEAFFQQLNKLLDNGNLERNANVYTVLVLNPAISPKVFITLLYNIWLRLNCNSRSYSSNFTILVLP